MTKVIGVRFRTAGKIYFFSPGKFEVKRGDQVIVETARGVEFGNVVMGPKEVKDEEITQPLKTYSSITASVILPVRLAGNICSREMETQPTVIGSSMRFIIWKEKNWKKVQNMRLDKKDMVLYAVTDRHWLNGESLYSQVEKALKGGATFIQLREKNLGEEEFLAEAKEIARLCKSYGIAIGSGVIVAKYYGARDIPNLQKSIHTTVGFGLICGVILTIVGIIAAPQILVLMGTPEAVLPNSITYFRIYFTGSESARRQSVAGTHPRLLRMEAGSYPRLKGLWHVC